MADCPEIYYWPTLKPGRSYFSNTVGRLVLTEQWLLFLSSGGTDVTVGAFAAEAFGVGRWGPPATDHLDLRALNNPHSVAIALLRIQSCRTKGMARYLTLTYLNQHGAPAHASFSAKIGGLLLIDDQLIARTMRGGH